MGNIYENTFTQEDEKALDLLTLGELFGVQSGISGLYETASRTLEDPYYAY